MKVKQAIYGKEGYKLENWIWINILWGLSSVQSLSHVWLSATPCTTERQKNKFIINHFSNKHHTQNIRNDQYWWPSEILTL